MAPLFRRALPCVALERSSRFLRLRGYFRAAQGYLEKRAAQWPLEESVADLLRALNHLEQRLNSLVNALLILLSVLVLVYLAVLLVLLLPIFGEQEEINSANWHRRRLSRISLKNRLA